MRLYKTLGSILDWRPETIFLVLFTFFLPFKNSLFNIIAAGYVIYLLYMLFRSKLPIKRIKISSLRETKYLSLLFVAIALSLFYSEDTNEGWKIVTRSITLLLFPLFFAFISFKEKEKNLVLIGFAYANMIAFVINCIRAFWRSIEFTEGKLIFDASVLGNQPFWYSIVQGGNHFFLDQFSTFLHPTYWSTYLLISSISIISLVKSGKDPHISKHKIGYCLICVLLLLGVYLCSSRIVMIAACFVVLIFFITVSRKKKSFTVLTGGLACLIALCIFILNSPRVGGIQNLANHIKYDMRMDSWRASLHVSRQHPVFGAGVGDSEKELLEKYREFGLEDNYKSRLDEHNQFLQIASQCGIVGLLLFCAGLISGLIRATRQNDFFKTSFIVVILLVCLTECFISRQAGITFFSLYYCLLFVEGDRRHD